MSYFQELSSFPNTTSFSVCLYQTQCKRTLMNDINYFCSRKLSFSYASVQFHICKQCSSLLVDCRLLSSRMLFLLISSLELHRMTIFLVCSQKPQIHQRSNHSQHLDVGCLLDLLKSFLKQLSEL